MRDDPHAKIPKGGRRPDFAFPLATKPVRYVRYQGPHEIGKDALARSLLEGDWKRRGRYVVFVVPTSRTPPLP